MNELAKGEKFMSLGSFAISDDAGLLAYSTDNVGFRQYRLHIKDLRTGKLMPDSAERIDSIAWAADNMTLFYTTEDATTKRSNLVFRHALGTDAKADPNPLFVYGYGSYGITMPDTFSANLLPLLDRGVVTTVAHIRGGGELIEAWHDDGKMTTKRNTFTDFIDTTEGLLAKGYGKPGQVGIEGGSAGGLLMGAVTNMRPDLFKVVLCEVPFVDVMNTMLDASLPLTVS